MTPTDTTEDDSEGRRETMYKYVTAILAALFLLTGVALVMVWVV
jgi:hypothetical protein